LDSSYEGLSGPRKRHLIEVPTRRLDDLNITITRPFFVKIDAQGAEPFIFLGGETTLAQADVIVSEWSPYQMRRMGVDPFAMISIMRKYFHLGAINPNAMNEALKPAIEEFCTQLAGMLEAYKGVEYADMIIRKRNYSNDRA
jgi:hypothetical protein